NRNNCRDVHGRRTHRLSGDENGADPRRTKAFTPQNLGNINVGDTITWKNNDSHNVVSANIPAGATAFESPFMTGATASFSQTFTVTGNYRYLCTLHAS